MTEPNSPPYGYDEFGLFHENIAEFDLGPLDVPAVERVGASSADGLRTVSALRWGVGEPEVVFLHGGAQNAHTWDTVALAVGRPALAIDLPGHGHSDWRDDGSYTPHELADDVAAVLREIGGPPRCVVGMSLGGLTAMELAVRHPDLVASLVMVDITPGVNAQKTKAVIDFVDGPQSFSSFGDLLERTISFNPTRSESSLRRGILHNAHQLPDGSWQWRYDRGSHARRTAADSPAADSPDTGSSETGSGDAGSIDDIVSAALSPLWDDFAAVGAPTMLVRGSLSPVVDDDDVAEARRRRADVEVHLVDGAGHSVQGDRPVELAALLRAWLGPTAGGY